MKQFYKKVNLRSRCEMTDFLKNHFRYNTMNSWNGSTSYACNIKIYNLGLSSDIQDKLYELIDIEEFWIDTREIFDKFARRYDYSWQIGTNGRSGGYLVLYQGFTEPSGYKSYCIECGQENYKSIEETGGQNICGRCGNPSRVNYIKPPINININPGRSTDMGEDFEGFTMKELRERLSLVQEFDSVADNLVALALKTLNEYTVEDETYYVPKTRKVLVAKGGVL